MELGRLDVESDSTRNVTNGLSLIIFGAEAAVCLPVPEWLFHALNGLFLFSLYFIDDTQE